MRYATRTLGVMLWCSRISTGCFTNAWDSRGISFIVRLRKDSKITRKDAFPQPDDREQDILVDEAIELIGDDTSKKYSHPLRRVVVYCPYDSSRRKSGQAATTPAEPEHTIELITNNAHRESDTISALYKSRWQIEGFFMTIIEMNKSAVMCQIWTAMIAILPLQYLKFRAHVAFEGMLFFSVDFIDRFARLVGHEDSIFNDSFGCVAGECNC